MDYLSRLKHSEKPYVIELLAQLRHLRGRLPADFHFDRLEANQDKDLP